MHFFKLSGKAHFSFRPEPRKINVFSLFELCGFFVILSKNIGKLFVALSNHGTIMHLVDLSAKLFERIISLTVRGTHHFSSKKEGAVTMQSHTVVYNHSEAQFSSSVAASIMQTNRKLLLLKMINY